MFNQIKPSKLFPGLDNEPVTQVSEKSDKNQAYKSEIPNAVSSQNYAQLSNSLVQVLSALTNLRDREYHVTDTAYRIMNVLEQQITYIDHLIPHLMNAYSAFKYAYERYRQASGNAVMDPVLEGSFQLYCQAVEMLSQCSELEAYKQTLKSLNKASQSIESLIGIMLEQYTSQLDDLEADIEVGEHQDNLSDIYPDRMKSLIHGEYNVKSFKLKTTVKANQYSDTISQLEKFLKTLVKSRVIINTFQSKQAVILNQIEDFLAVGNKDEVEKRKEKLKSLIGEFLQAVEGDWSNLKNMWVEIDTPSSPLDSADAATARHIRKTMQETLSNRPESIAASYRNITKWVEYLISALNKAKQNGGSQDQRSKWYIGNNKVLTDISKFKADVELAYATNLAKAQASTLQDGAIVVKINQRLGEYIQAFSKFVSSDVALDLSRGERWVQDSLSKAKIIWSQVESLHNAYSENKALMSGFRGFDKNYENLEDAASKLMTVTSEQDRFLHISRIVDTAILIKTTLPGITIKGNASPTDSGIYASNVSMVQTEWAELAKAYSELLKMAPRNLRDQINHIVKNPPELVGRYTGKFNTWYTSILNLIDQLAEFATFYIRIKSLYPLTIALRAFGSPNGKDIENVKYIESMHALLREALAGKSLTAAKSALLREAAKFYPEDERVMVANKMYDITLSGI
jgi:hypothetical protein